MSRIVIFGAGGRAGRRAVAEAVSRGHEVTSVVRDPSRHPDLPGLTTVLREGDATDPVSVAAVSSGHDVAICTIYSPDADPTEVYVSAAKALIAGLSVKRLIVIGVRTDLDNPFSSARAAELDYFEQNGNGLDWVFVTPPPVVLTDEGYTEVAVAVLDEIERPTRHQAQLAIGL